MNMTVLRAYLHPCLLAVSLLMAGGALSAEDAAAASNTQGPSAAPAPSAQGSSAAPVHVSHGRFQDFLVYKAAGPQTSFALLLSGDEGWTSTADTMARQLAQRGAMVAGIDWAKLKANLEADGDQCVSPDGDLENLSHFVQAYVHSPTYLPPVLVGVSGGAGLAYAVLAQAPKDTFAAALTLGFCPGFTMQKPLCKGAGLEFIRGTDGHGVEFLPAKSLSNPWLNLQGESDRSCPIEVPQTFISQVRGAALVTLPKVGRDYASPPRWLPQYTAGYNSLAAHNPAARVARPPAGLSDLPVIEVPAQTVAAPPPAASAGATRSGVPPGAVPSDTFAIIMSGDGGWAGLDQDVAAALTAKGIPVVGLDSLRYYWTPRTPSGLAADTDRMILRPRPRFPRNPVRNLGLEPASARLRDRPAFALRVARHLIAVDLAHTEVVGLRVREIESADRGRGKHGEGFGQSNAGILFGIEQPPQSRLLGVLGAGGIARAPGEFPGYSSRSSRRRRAAPAERNPTVRAAPARACARQAPPPGGPPAP
jgi:type IV secretory pathway VirJ component